MKKWMTLFTAIAIISIVSWGCARTENGTSANSSHGHDHGEEGHDDHAGHDHGEGGHDHGEAGHDDHAGHNHADGEHGAVETVAVALYCGDCGHGYAKDAEHTCDSAHEVCKCGFHKGSELCCKVEGDFAGKALCASCGEVAGTDVCCKADAAVCEKCGLHTGAPLCCKLGAKDDAAVAAPVAPAAEEAAVPAAPAEAPAAPAPPAE